MNQTEQPRGYQGSYLIGFVVISVVAIRTILFYRYQSNLANATLLLLIYTLLYSLEPWLSRQYSWFEFFYFPAQTMLVVPFTFLRPFLDFQTLLYFPLIIQAFRAFPFRAALLLSIGYIFLVGIAIIPGLGLLGGIAFILLSVAVGSFLISYDFLYMRTQARQAESQRLLADLQAAHRKLQDYAVQAEELAAIRERNRLARELHDSVSQAIFSITLTSQSARLLLEREPARVTDVLQRIQTMTASALGQLRSLIAELRPQ